MGISGTGARRRDARTKCAWRSSADRAPTVPACRSNESFPFYLQRNMRQEWRALHAMGPVTVVNLAVPVDDLASFADSIADYAYLQPDLYVIVIDHGAALAADERGWRRQSAVFRATGYMPLLSEHRRKHTGARVYGGRCGLLTSARAMR